VKNGEYAVFGFVDIPGILAWIIYLGFVLGFGYIPMFYDITLLFTFVMTSALLDSNGQDQYIEILPVLG